MAVKKYMLDTAREFKGDAGQDDIVPRAALGDVVPRSGGRQEYGSLSNLEIPILFDYLL